MDEIDLAIIEDLKRDARTSFGEIAKMLKIPPQTVSNRVARLIKEGVILGFITITDSMKLKRGILAFIEVNVKPGHSERVAREITGLKDGLMVFETIGTHDLILCGFFRDHKGYTRAGKRCYKRCQEIREEVKVSSMKLKVYVV